MKTRHRITLAFGAAASAVLVVLAATFLYQLERALLAQHERTLTTLAESVALGLREALLAGRAEAAQAHLERLRAQSGVAALRILRANGEEAFRDNATLAAVNDRLGPRGHPAFAPRAETAPVAVLPPDDANLRRAIDTQSAVALRGNDAAGGRTLTLLAPLKADAACSGCHAAGEAVPGVIALGASLAGVDDEVAALRRAALGALLVAIATTIALAVVLARLLARPLETLSATVAGGGREPMPPAAATDELGRIAHGFEQLGTELRRAREDLRREQDKLTTIIHGVGDGIVVTNGGGEVVLVNPAAEALLGKSAAEVAGAGFAHLLDAPDTLRCLLDGTLPVPHTVDYRDRVIAIHATTIAGEDGRPLGSAALLRDVTEQKRHEEFLRVQLATDALTGLHNRRHLEATLAVEFHRSVRTGTALSVLVLDIDRFADFNDRHGREQGDRVLQAVACKMREALRKYDVACRCGGEEFVAILPNAGSSEARNVAERLRADIEATTSVSLHFTVSIGIASTPELVVDTPEALLEAAGAVLAAAKDDGGNRTSVARA